MHNKQATNGLLVYTVTANHEEGGREDGGGRLKVRESKPWHYEKVDGSTVIMSYLVLYSVEEA